MFRFAFFAALAFNGCCCWGSAAVPVTSEAEVPGVYELRVVNDFYPSNRITLNRDGGYCHDHIVDGGTQTECGAWEFKRYADTQWMTVRLKGIVFEPPYTEFSDGAFTIESWRSRRHLVVDDDNAVYFEVR